MIENVPFRVEAQQWRQLPDGSLSLRLRVQPDFVFTFASGREEEYTVEMEGRITQRTLLSTLDTKKLLNDVAMQMQMMITHNLGRTLFLSSRGYILRLRGNGRPRGRPISDARVKETPRIITV